MDNVLNDNIAHSEINVTPQPIKHSEPTEQDAEDYMKRFESVDNQCTKLHEITILLKRQPDQDHRVRIMMNFIEAQQKLNTELYDLLVEMNNFFAPK
jgi:hypothetical protein